METAKVFTSGNSQAVRLPKEYRFNSDEVYIKKFGNSIILSPKEQIFENFLEGIMVLQMILWLMAESSKLFKKGIGHEIYARYRYMHLFNKTKIRKST